MNYVGKYIRHWTPVLAVAPLGLLLSVAANATAQDVECHGAPMVKNLRSYSSRCVAETPQPRPLTHREARKLAAIAKSPAEHLKLADYYKTEGDWLDAEGAQYEKAAADTRNTPYVKNL